jgi:predicted SAM-dependent methyltransferase
MESQTSHQKITRVQIGVSRLEYLEPKVLQTFLNKSWMHLGDSKHADASLGSSFIKIFRKHSLSFILKRGFQKVFGYGKPSPTVRTDAEKINNLTNFKEFYYRKGDLLPFESTSIDFIFSEHFFEHLFFDEALALLRECSRILKPFGVIRISVPDADLRIYELPEPPGFPDVKLPFDDPTKHKTRWSFYLLAEALKIAGCDPFPLRYCDKSGRYIRVDPSEIRNEYDSCPDREIVFEMSYIRRLDSLIVDGIKKSMK